MDNKTQDKSMVKRVETQATLVPRHRGEKLTLFLTAPTRYLGALKKDKGENSGSDYFYFLPLSEVPAQLNGCIGRVERYRFP